MHDKELQEVLSRLNVSLNRIDRGNYIRFMLEQQTAERSTPPNATFGSAIVNSVSIAFTQVLQRNDRRKYAEFVTPTLTATHIMFANSDRVDAKELAQAYVNGITNSTDVVLNGVSIYAVSSNPIRIDSTGPIYVGAFSIGSGGTAGKAIAAQGGINWQESIYSDMDAIPGFMVEHRAKPGDVDKLTAGTLKESILGEDFESAFGRGGVR